MAQVPDTSETAVANEALSHIRKPGITSIDDDVSNTCTVVKKHFAPVRDALQRRYPWNFCEEFATLSASGTMPLAQFRYGYTLPSDPFCLRLLEVIGCGENDWKVMRGRRLVCNRAAPIRIRFTARTVEVPNWDALFRSAFALHLAAALAPELAADENITAGLREEAAAMLEQAYPSDAAESGGDELADTDWVTCR